MADSREFLIKLSQQLADDGRLIEAGWTSLRAVAIPPHAQSAQLEAMRMAFFAGAQHLWGSIFQVLGPGGEPTNEDMSRMSAINRELQEFVVEFAAKHRINIPKTH